MAFVHGKGGVFKIDNAGGTLTTLTTYITEWSINQTVETADTTTMGSEAHTYVSGRSDGTLSVSGLYDSTASTGPDVTLSGLVGLETSSTFEVGPEGGTSPDTKYSGECFLTGYEISVMASDVAKFTADFQITGAITKGAFA